jgi:hypothetical protein
MVKYNLVFTGHDEAITVSARISSDSLSADNDAVDRAFGSDVG